MDKIEEAVIGEGERQTDRQLEGLNGSHFCRKQWSEGAETQLCVFLQLLVTEGHYSHDESGMGQ